MCRRRLNALTSVSHQAVSDAHATRGLNLLLLIILVSGCGSRRFEIFIMGMPMMNARLTSPDLSRIVGPRGFLSDRALISLQLRAP